MAKAKKGVLFRSAKSGRIVKKAFAKKHPATTERETFKRAKKRK
jgi:hypothetical protein